MDAVTDRIAFRVESSVVDGASAVSFSGYFDPTSTLAEKDALIDELMAVAERQRAKQLVFQVQAELDANQRVLEQEKKRMGDVLGASETQKANGGIQDATAQALRASQQNVQRLENEVLKSTAKLEALQPMLRTQPAPGA